jgi:hypothetical protein
MKKAFMTLAALIIFTGIGLAQSQPKNSGEKQKAKKTEKENLSQDLEEATDAANHGQTVSQTAKSTPSGPEKGKTVSQTARSKEKNNPKHKDKEKVKEKEKKGGKENKNSPEANSGIPDNMNQDIIEKRTAKTKL